MRKTIAIIAALALIVSTTASSALAVNETTVLNSGKSLDVNTTSVSNTNVNVTNNNTANIVQTSVQNNNTGGNVAAGNISVDPCNPCVGTGTGTTIDTGNATSTSNQQATGNTNATGISIPAQTTANNGTSVVNTAGNADVNTTDVATTNVNVTNTNTAMVFQNSVENNNTGFNAGTGNIGATSIVTGNAGASSTQAVNVNSNATVVEIVPTTSTTQLNDCFTCGMPCLGGNCTDIMNTGNKLTVNSVAVTTNNVNVKNTNSLFAMQSTLQNNNTGFNYAGDNIYGAGILTGSAVSASGQSVTGNANATGVSLGAIGMPLGSSNLLSVLNSGADVTTNATAVENTGVNTTNLNTQFGFQATWSSSNTGTNISVNNIGGGTTATGGTGAGSTQGLGGNSNLTLIGGMNLLTLFGLMLL